MANKKVPSIPDIDTMLQAGFDPLTRLPIAFRSDSSKLKENIRKNLRILDEQDAINRYKWYNLPSGLDGQLVERILYYKGQGMFFYEETIDTFFFLPFDLDGTIDIYGRFTGTKALPFNGKEEDFPSFVRKVVVDYTQITSEDMTNGCVLLADYSKQISQTNIARQILMDPILDAMAEAFPFARTNLIANSGIKAVRVNNENEAQNVKLASQSVTKASLEGTPFIPTVGATDFQDFTSDGSPMKSEEYLSYMQALDNFRLSLYGLKTGGLFQKKSHMLEAEQDMNSGNTLLAYQDGLTLRQRFCDFVNAIWGLGIWCKENEEVQQAQNNMQEEDPQESKPVESQEGEENE